MPSANAQIRERAAERVGELIRQIDEHNSILANDAILAQLDPSKNYRLVYQCLQKEYLFVLL